VKKLSITLLTTLFLFLFIASSFAKFPCFWKDKKLVKEIGLSEKQVNTIQDISINIKKKMIKLRADIELKEVDLKEILDCDNPNEGKAVGLIKEIMKLKTDARIAKTKQMITIKKTLTSEQLEKLEEIKRERAMRKGSGPEGKGKAPPKQKMRRMKQ